MSSITPLSLPDGDYQTFEWTDLPATIPAHDVTVHASYTSGIAEIIMAQGNVRIYGPDGKPRKNLQRSATTGDASTVGLKKGLRSTSGRFASAKNIVRMSNGTTKKVVVK